MTTQNYSLAEARAIFSEYNEYCNTDYKTGEFVVGESLDAECERMINVLNDQGINDNTPSGDN